VRVVRTPGEAEAAAGEILGMVIGSERVEQLLVEVASRIEAEYYASVTLDRRTGSPLLMVSAQGGMEVEAAGKAATATVHVDPLLGLADFQARALVFDAGLDPAVRGDAVRILHRLYRLFVEADAQLVEVNPLAVTTADGAALLALDAKVTLDDSALYRHPELRAYRGTRRPDPQEQMAAEAGLNFVKLDGDVGIIGNGAGLVMATLDVVAQAGGAPADFLDVGGGAGADVLARALDVVLAGPGVRSVLVNIFGGITRCDLVAGGILEALGRTPASVPIVVRLEGTNAREGRSILARANHPTIQTAKGMLEAARQAVEAAR
jgi:succinyl-CoA synthetase beta subunit